MTPQPPLAMITTSVTLLGKLVGTDETARRDAWVRFVHLYSPLLVVWAGRCRLHGNAAADFVQEALGCVFIKMPKYRRVEGKAFRGWLFTIVINNYRDFLGRRCNRPLMPADAAPEPVAPVEPDLVAEMDEQEYRLRLVREAREAVRRDFSAATMDAFRLIAEEGRTPEEAAAALEITPDAARAAARRVRERIAEQVEGLLD